MTDLPITDPIAAIVASVSAEKMDPTPEDYVRAGMEAAAAWHKGVEKAIRDQIEADDTMFTSDLLGERMAGHYADAETIREMMEARK